MKPALKPLASKHHSEIQAIGDRAAKKMPTVADLDTALAAAFDKPPSTISVEIAELAFGWSRHVLALGGWGFWSVSTDGTLNPALVRWDKAWFLFPVDTVLLLQGEKRPGCLAALLEQLRLLPKGAAGTLEEVFPSK